MGRGFYRWGKVEEGQGLGDIAKKNTTGYLADPLPSPQSKDFQITNRGGLKNISTYIS